MVQDVIQYLDAIFPLQEELKEELRKIGITKTYLKDERVLQTGEIANYASFIVKGLVRSYYIREDGEEITDYFGVQTTVKLDKLRTTNLAYVIGQGLKAMDRQAVASQMQGLFFALIQAPAAGQQVDIIKMLDFWTSMMDIDASMEEFRLPPQPQPGMPGGPAPEAAGGTGIVPATNPNSLTTPIYG